MTTSRDATQADPSFDVNDRISAIYELGITTGARSIRSAIDGRLQARTVLVTRAQMASLLMRTMGHTNLRPAGLSAQSTNEDTQVSLRDADFVPIVGERTEVITTNFPEDAFNANGACIDRFVRNQVPGFSPCEMDVGDRLTDPASDEEGNALWLGVGLKTGNELIILCTTEGGAGSYTFMAPSTRGADTDYTIFAWTGGVGDVANKDNLIESAEANVLTTLNDATKAVVTGGVPGANIGDTGTHVPMGGSVTYTVQLRDRKGNPVGPTPNEFGEMPTFEVQIDTYTEQSWPSDNQAGLADLLSGDTYDPAPDDDVEVQLLVPVWDTDLTDEAGFVDAFGTADDFTRRRFTYEPDDSGQFTFTVTSRDRQRHENNADTVKRVFIRRDAPVTHSLPIIDMTTPMGPEAVSPDDVRGAEQLADVRFSDNGATARTVMVDAVQWRLRGVRNRNSISVSVHDQYSNLYRVGDHEVQASDGFTIADFPGAIPGPFGANITPQVAEDATPTLRGGYSVGTSGRRSIGYTHNGAVALEQTVTLQLRVPGALGSLADTDADPQIDAVPSVNPVPVITGMAEATIYWADRGLVHNNTTGEKILVGDAASNEIIVDTAFDPQNLEAATVPIAYPYGADDKFVVESEVVTIDQFEEILLQYDPRPVGWMGLISNLGTLSWVGYDFNRPRDGATWSIDGLTCREPVSGD